MFSLPLSPNPPTSLNMWCSPPCVHVFSWFNSHLWVRTCGVWFSVLALVSWEWWFLALSMSLQRTWTHPFLWLHSIPWYICVTFPSLYPCVLIVQHPPMSENMWCLLFCSCVSLLRIMVSRFTHVPAKDMNSSFFFFYGCIVFHGVFVPHFPCPVYHWWAFGLAPGLCYCKQCHNEHMCACVFIIERFIILWVYTQ